MRHPQRLAVVLTFVLALLPAAARADGLVTRGWEEPVTIGGDDLFEQDAGLSFGGLIISVQQRESTSGRARIGVTETDGLTGAATDSPLIGIELPPILPPLPELALPTLPLPLPGELPLAPLPVKVDASELRLAPELGAPRVATKPLALSASASAVRGVPRELGVRVRCDRSCAVHATGRLAGTTMKAARGALKAGQTARLAIRLPRAARRIAIARLRRDGRATARVAVAAVTAGGLRAELTLRVTLRRR